MLGSQHPPLPPPPCPTHAAQHALQDALAQQRDALLARDSEAAARAAAASEHQLALDAARRAEAGLRERLGMAERQLEHHGGEVRALREANEKLDLALAALRVGHSRVTWSGLDVGWLCLPGAQRRAPQGDWRGRCLAECMLVPRAGLWAI